MRAWFLVAILTACGSEPAPPPPDRALPGPCSSSAPSGLRCTFTYDGDLLVGTTCLAPESQYSETRDYADGVLTEVVRTSGDRDSDLDGSGDLNERTSWSFPELLEIDSLSHDEYGPLETRTYRHEAASFEPIDIAVDPRWGPYAADSVVTYETIQNGPKGEPGDLTTYTYDPPERPTDGTRTRSDGAEFTYAAGHLVRAFVSLRETVFRWDGDRLVGIDSLDYVYDDYGNVIEVRGTNGALDTSYDYSCWD